MDVARLQGLRFNDSDTTGNNDIIAEFHGYIVALQVWYRFLSIHLMTAYSPVTSCPCVLRCIIGNVRHTVQGFTLDALCFLALCTEFFFLCLAYGCLFLCDPSLFGLLCIFPAPCGLSNLLPHGKISLCFFNGCLTLFLRCNLLRNGRPSFGFGFLYLFQRCFLVGNHSVRYGLRHCFIAICLFNYGIPSELGSFSLLIDRISLLIFRNTLESRHLRLLRLFDFDRILFDFRCFLFLHGLNKLSLHIRQILRRKVRYGFDAAVILDCYLIFPIIRKFRLYNSMLDGTRPDIIK